MAAFLMCFNSWIRGHSNSSFKHAFGLKFPPVMHKVLDSDFITRFKEVFVIGDIHGCYDDLVKLLNKASVEDDSVLKLYVGDLVNKGPSNHEVINLLRNSPSMLSVRGNHDEVVLREYYRSKEPNYKCDKAENLWMKDLPKEDIDYLDNLPYTISIPSLKAIIVHAGIVPGISLEGNDPQKLVTMRSLIFGDYFNEGGIQATKDIKTGQAWASFWPGPDHVYFGHDAARMLQIYPNATGLDTGCVYGNRLTGLFISGPKAGHFVTVEAMKTYRQTGKQL